MVKVEGLVSLGVSENVVDALWKEGIKELYEWQFNVFRDTDVVNGRNLVVSVPTGAGKTLVAKVMMLQKLFQKGGKVVYIAPLRSLAIEKYNEFRKWKKFGFDVKVSTGGFSSDGKDLSKADVIVTTFEKFDSLMRHRATWLEDVGLLVIDEIHTITEPERGAILENILIWAKDNTQVIGLSATVENLHEIGEWLGADVFIDDFRPVNLRKGVFCSGRIWWEDGSIERLYGKKDWVRLVVDRVQKGRNVIVFVHRRNSAERFAKKVAFELARNSIVVPNIESEITDDVAERFGNIVYNGVGFHHAGLSSSQRLWVENMFRKKLLHVIVATPTLAMGLNLPADTVIIKDLTTYSGDRLSWLDVMDVWQMMGRAGRPGLSEHGEAILVVNNKKNVQFVLDRYIYGKFEKVLSKTVFSKQFVSQILTLLASFGYRSVDEIIQHYHDSLFMYQYGDDTILKNRVEKALRWLVNNYFVFEETMYAGGYDDYGVSDDESEFVEYSVSEYGQRTVELYVLPHTAKLFRDYFESVQNYQSLIGVLFLIVSSYDMELPNVSIKDFNKYIDDIDYLLNEIYQSVSIESENDLKKFIARYKAVTILEDWMNGLEVDEIAKRYGVGRGDVSKVVEYGEWLLYSFAELYKVEYGKDDVYKWLRDLVVRVKYGVPEYLVPFVRMRGVGRKTAFKLWNSGIRSVDDIRRVGRGKLAELGVKQKTLDMMIR